MATVTNGSVTAATNVPVHELFSRVVFPALLWTNHTENLQSGFGTSAGGVRDNLTRLEYACTLMQIIQNLIR